jgi:hypothetical protein
MANSTGKKMANDTGDWGSNKEMNPMANSSITEDGLLESDNELDNGDEWRRTAPVPDHGISAGTVAQKPGTNRAGDPGRTPGTAEGVENPEKKGNEL